MLSASGEELCRRQFYSKLEGRLTINGALLPDIILVNTPNIAIQDWPCPDLSG